MGLPGSRKKQSPGSFPSLPDNQENQLQDVDTKARGKAKGKAKAMTKTRRNSIIVSCLCYLVACVFLILVEIGNINGSKVPGDIYFFRLDLSNIIPQAAVGLSLTNSIARTLGLHDFYQVGLWNFCEGYGDSGITTCSPTQSFFWFNPVQIVQSELLAGASVGLPANVNDILDLVRIASHVMFGFFITGLVLSFVLMLAAPVVLRSRWWSLPFSIFAFMALLMVAAATIIGTTMSVIVKVQLTAQDSLNIGVNLGSKMFAFMWIATGCTLVSFLIHAALGCCCTSRRDVQNGRKGREDVPPESSNVGPSGSSSDVTKTWPGCDVDEPREKDR